MNNFFGFRNRNIMRVKNGRPDAVAMVIGVGDYPELSGIVAFYQNAQGVLVVASFENLPSSGGECGGEVLGFHIHEGNSCTGNAEDMLADTKSHYNPKSCQHPYHAGDLPPLFSNNGIAYMSVLTNRFTVKEIIGRTVVVHNGADDFTTQPSGKSGKRIACGVINRV